MDGSSDSDGDHAGEELLSQRATLDVGRRLPLRALGGACIGDDVSWKGSKVTRFALLQTAGSRGSLVEWGVGGGMRSLISERTSVFYQRLGSGRYLHRIKRCGAF